MPVLFVLDDHLELVVVPTVGLDTCVWTTRVWHGVGGN